MSGPNLDLINSKTIEIIQDKVESSVRRKTRNRSPRKSKINSRAGNSIVPQDFGLPTTEPNLDLIKNKTGSNDKVQFSATGRKSRSGSLSKIEANTRDGETKAPDFSRIRSKTCTITRPYITDCPPKLLDLALNSIQKAMDSKSKISQDQVEAKTPSPKTQLKPTSKAQNKQISEKTPIKVKSKIPLRQNQGMKISDSDDSISIEKSFQAPNLTSRLELIQDLNLRIRIQISRQYF